MIIVFAISLALFGWGCWECGRLNGRAAKQREIERWAEMIERHRKGRRN